MALASHWGGRGALLKAIGSSVTRGAGCARLATVGSLPPSMKNRPEPGEEFTDNSPE